MNNKLVGRKEAVEKLKVLEKSQRFYKRILSKENRPVEIRALYQAEVFKRKESINLLLSLIDANKKASRLYEEVRYLKAKDD